MARGEGKIYPHVLIFTIMCGDGLRGMQREAGVRACRLHTKCAQTPHVERSQCHDAKMTTAMPGQNSLLRTLAALKLENLHLCWTCAGKETNRCR